jgi:hypothetical protein
VDPAALKPSRLGHQNEMLEQLASTQGLLSGVTARPRGGVLFHQLAGPANIKFAWAAEFKYDSAAPVLTASKSSFGAKNESNNGQSFAGFASAKSSS